ncbi:hypothetical protein [Gloeothece verrucosa]|uniref:Uncharacterized protein n=1 Tax=Gloeothece verrucosa (strain PCC 7822) TaxID=497965 RepID=E0UKG9_GLOV7|nr:hypothetical protein [Gloeothece verrucosa]ADN17050.1 hypothetical protein Cyan7822_5167 [Gloeothece verrucosa PCC 7822]
MQERFLKALEEVHALDNNQWEDIKHFLNGESTLIEASETFGLSELACYIIKRQFDPRDLNISFAPTKDETKGYPYYYILPHDSMLSWLINLIRLGVSQQELVDKFQFHPTFVKAYTV